MTYHTNLRLLHETLEYFGCLERKGALGIEEAFKSVEDKFLGEGSEPPRQDPAMRN